jgi:hypothetical protein
LLSNRQDFDDILEATLDEVTMDNTMAAIEVTGRVDEQHRLQLDAPLPISGPRRVRIIVLYSAEDGFDEAEWLSAAARNPAFDFLRDVVEDIYSETNEIPLN